MKPVPAKEFTSSDGISRKIRITSTDEENDKLITELMVTFDKNYQVLSNGSLLSEKDNKNGTHTWHYRMSHPHAGYLVMLGIGKYAVKHSKSKNGVPMNFWYYP